MNLPGLIGERVFTLFDKNQDGYSEKGEFIEASLKLLCQNFDENVKLIFQLYDFDNDGIVSKDDIRVLLSHVPLSEILANKKNKARKEGTFTKSGGGL